MSQQILTIDITGDNSDLKKKLLESKSELQKFKQEITNIRPDVFNGLITPLKDLKKSFQELIRLGRQLNSGLGTSGGGGSGSSSLAQARLDAANYRTEIAKLNRDLAALRLANAQNNQTTQAAAGSYREAQQRLTALGSSIRNAANGFNSNDPIIRNQIIQYRRLRDELARFDSQMGNNYRNVGNYGSALSGAIPIVGQLTSVAGLATLAVAGLQKSFAYNTQIDAFKTALKVISGDTITFNDNLEFLRSTSDRLGLDFLSTANAFKQWQGAAKFSNIELGESRKIFESVANAGAKLKLSTDQVQGAFLALSQMVSKGKVQAEELRGQLGERLPGAFALAAKAMNVTEKELNKMLEKGEVIANDFLPKFAAQLDKSFGNDKTEKIESLQASVNRLNNEFNNLFESDRATAFFQGTSNGLATLLKDINNFTNSNTFKNFISSMLSIGGGNDILTTTVRSGFDSTSGKRITKNERAVQKTVKGFTELSVREQELRIAKQKEIVDSRVGEYNSRNNKENLERLTLQTSVLAELNRLYYSNKKAQVEVENGTTGDAKKTKGKTQAEIIKESNDALQGGQIDNLRGIDKELAKIDLKWSKIGEKIDLITDSKLKDQLTQQIKLGKELDKSILALDTFAKAKDLKGVTGAQSVSLSGTLNTNLPSSAGLLNSKAGRKATWSRDAVIESESFSKEFTKSLRKNFAQSLTGFFDDLSSISQNTYDIEQRYNKLRADASADQIQALNKMEKLEKRINNGFTSMLTNAFNSISRIGSTAITSSISTGLSGGGWGDLTKMFKGDQKGYGYAALGGLGGGAISGLSKPTNTAGQVIGGALSGAGTGLAVGLGLAGAGAAIGSVVPVVGTIVGAAVGAIVGIFKSNAAKRQRELEELQLKEQQKQTALQQRIAQLSYQSSIIGQMTNQGTVQGFDRDAFGNIVGRIDGKDILLVTERAKNMGS